MAEETPVVQNWRLLIVAGVLGLVMSIIYVVHLNAVRNALQSDNVQLMRITRDLQAGDKIKPTDIEFVAVPRTAAQGPSFEGVMDKGSFDFVNGQAVNQGIQKNTWLSWSHVTQGGADSQRSRVVTQGMTTYPLSLDPSQSPGDILSVGDHVTIRGTFAVGNAGARSCTILDGARVLAIGGKGQSDKVGGRAMADAGMTSYRTILIEVSPEVAKQLDNVMSHAQGGIRVGVKNPGETVPATPPGPQLDKEVAPFAGSAAPTNRNQN